MLQRLRQYRRRLAGTFGVLFGSAWLMLAAGPCVAAMQVEMEDHCPHCDHASLPCATLEMSDCDLPLALVSAPDPKPKSFAALPATEFDVPADPRPQMERMPAVSATGPPHPPFTSLFCSYQE